VAFAKAVVALEKSTCVVVAACAFVAFALAKGIKVPSLPFRLRCPHGCRRLAG
jgi:hypothetical protein